MAYWQNFRKSKHTSCQTILHNWTEFPEKRENIFSRKNKIRMKNLNSRSLKIMISIFVAAFIRARNVMAVYLSLSSDENVKKYSAKSILFEYSFQLSEIVNAIEHSTNSNLICRPNSAPSGPPYPVRFKQSFCSFFFVNLYVNSVCVCEPSWNYG